MRPLVSLATPVCNSMPYFRDFLNCVMAQTWRPLELIVVDGYSNDGSWEYLMELVPALERTGISVQAIRRERHGGPAAMSDALSLVSGEYFTWCDPDDLMTVDSIEKKAEYLIRHSELDLVRSDGIVVNGDIGRRLAHSAKAEDRCTQNIFDALFFGTTYCYAGCYMVRTSLLFDCYPEKWLPVGCAQAGTNLLLLLPPASRSDCGFLPESLHIYCIRSNGDSSRKRSFTEAKARVESFSTLRRAILPYCACDREHYITEDRKILEQELQLLCRTAVSQIRKERTR